MKPKNFIKDIRKSYRDANVFIKVSIWASTALLIYTILGFFAVPFASIYLIENNISKSINRTIQVKDIYFNPFNFRIKISGLRILDKNSRNKNNIFLGIHSLDCNFEFTKLLNKHFIFKNLYVNKIRLNIIRYKNKKFNFSDLLKDKKNNKNSIKNNFLFSINNIKISNSTVIFKDNIKNSIHKITRTNINIPFISNIEDKKDIYILPYFSSYIDGQFVELKGKTKPFEDSKDTILNIKISNFDITKYKEYIDIPYKIKLISGNLDSNLAIHFKKENSPFLKVNGLIDINNLVLSKQNIRFFKIHNLNINLKEGLPIKKLFVFDIKMSNLQLKDFNEKTFLTFNDLIIKDSKIDLNKNIISFSHVKLDKPDITLKRYEDNSINFANYINRLLERSPLARENKEQSTKNSLNYKLRLESFTINNGSLNFTDNRDVIKPVSINFNDFFMNIKNFEYPEKKYFSLSFSSKCEHGGIVSISANCSSDFKDIMVHSQISGIFLPILDGYIGNYLNGSLTRGNFYFKGGIHLKNYNSVVLNGDSKIEDFIFLDNNSGMPFIKFKEITLKNIFFKNNPISVKIDNIYMIKILNQIIKFKQGETNIALLVRNKNINKQSIKNQKREKPTYNFNLKSINLSKCKFSFKDNSVMPNFIINIDKLDGSIKHINSLYKNTKGIINLVGLLNSQAKVSITGTVNLFNFDSYANISTQLNGVSINIFSPYIQKYLGYKVKKGKLYYTLDLNLDKSKLNANNRIILDQFKLGEHIQSKQATKLPVKLALAILRDRSGKIRLDIPVSGDLEDPNFSYGKVVFTAIKNIFIKIAMSPFSILASLVGTKEKLDVIEFVPGSSFLSTKEKDKLNKLALALKQRPGLKLEIEGYYSKDKDLRALKQKEFLFLLKKEKFNFLSKEQKAKISSINDIEIDQKEYLKYLELAYKKFISKKSPGNKNSQLEKKDMQKFMEDFLLKNITISPSKLKELARAREVAVFNYLSSITKIEPERIFIVSGDENIKTINLPIVRLKIGKL